MYEFYIVVQADRLPRHLSLSPTWCPLVLEKCPLPSIARDEKREGRVILIGLDEKDTLYCLAFPEFCIGCPSNEKKNISVGTETNRNKICFGCVLVCFVKPKPKTKNFGLFWFVSVFRT
jgi:hypothetical protein